MDRRSILAIVLIFALTLVWSKMSRQFFGTPTDGTAADSVMVASKRASSTGSGADRSGEIDRNDLAMRADDGRNDSQSAETTIEPTSGDFTFNAVNRRIVSVESDLIHAKFSSRGALPVSWQLIKYPGSDTPEVELIPPRDEFSRPPAGDVLVFSRGSIATGNIDFEPQGSLSVDVRTRAEDLVFLARTDDGLILKKTLGFTPGIYVYTERYDLSFTSSSARSAFLDKYGDPVSVRFIWDRGIAMTEAEVKGTMNRMQTDRSFAMVGEEMTVLMQKDLEKGGEKAGGAFRGSIRFAGLQNKYFGIIGFIPEAKTNIVEGRIRLGGDPESMNQSWEIELPLRDTSGLMSSSISRFMGPSEYNRLRDHGSSLEKTVNLGWKWIEWLSELVLGLLNWLHRFIPNYGWVIVAVSILSKLVFYPLTARGTRAMKKMQDSQALLKPKMDALKAKCGSDSQRYNQELMKLYKEEGVNPMAGMAGCLPMLIQMPVFIALYQVLYNMVDLRQTPFIFWIDDLSRPDALFALPFSLPFLGSSFNLLPIIMAIATWAQTKLTPQAGGGAAGQMAAMNNIMPVMMLFFLYNMPSGLVIYWTINTAMTAFQSWTVNRSAAAAAGVQA